MKAVFFDRDGVINDNSNHYYVYKKAHWKFNPGIVEVMKNCCGAGFLIFIVTNQGGISRGIYTKYELEELHRAVFEPLKPMGIEITDIAVCPHHPLIEHCLCRKPKPLLLEKLIARYNINVAQSWFIGDSDRDLQAAQAVGLKCLQVTPNSNILGESKIIWESLH